MNKRNIIPIKICEKILRRYSIRTSNEASRELSRTLEEIADQISKKASDYTKHAKRKTVKAKDIKLARGQ